MTGWRMLTTAGSAERSEAEYRALLAASGFQWSRALPLAGTMGVSLVEATAL